MASMIKGLNQGARARFTAIARVEGSSTTTFGWDRGYRWYRQETAAMQALPEV
jgi:hypothetical protein